MNSCRELWKSRIKNDALRSIGVRNFFTLCLILRHSIKILAICQKPDWLCALERACAVRLDLENKIRFYYLFYWAIEIKSRAHIFFYLYPNHNTVKSERRRARLSMVLRMVLTGWRLFGWCCLTSMRAHTARVDAEMEMRYTRTDGPARPGDAITSRVSRVNHTLPFSARYRDEPRTLGTRRCPRRSTKIKKTFYANANRYMQL